MVKKLIEMNQPIILQPYSGMIEVIDISITQYNSERVRKLELLNTLDITN